MKHMGSIPTPLVKLHKNNIGLGGRDQSLELSLFFSLTQFIN